MARDYLQAIKDRVVVYDGGMGATLEQFDLSAEDYGGLQGKCHEALILNRPDVIEGVHSSMLDAGAEVLETDTFQASRIKLEEWGLADYTVEINTKAAEIARKAAGATEARYGLAELHKRSGSKLPPHKFRHAIQEIVEAAVPLPDYDLSLVKGEGGPVLRMVNRAYDKNRVLQSASA